MKNFDVKELGLEELSQREVHNINGGIAPAVVYGVVFVAAVGVGVAIEHFGWRKNRK